MKATEDPLLAGWDLLRRGGWKEARAMFAAALASPLGATSEATAAEGAAAAAWWLDDDDEMTERYEQAYRCYRSVGDDRGAARVSAWLGNGAVQFRGEPAVAQGWFQRARRLLADLPEGAEHGQLTLFEGMAACLRGDLTGALEHADRTMEIGRRQHSPDLEIQGMALSGTAHVSQGRIGEGMRLLDEAAAAALAGEVHEVGSVWIPTCYLVQGCEQTRDWERAEQWCGRVMDFCRRFDLGSPFSRCRTHYSTVLLWRGDWEEAENQLLRAADDLSEQRPRFAAEAWARLGELRRRQGHWTEAAELFERGRPLPAARVGLAELLLDRGDAADAVELVERVLDGLPKEDRLARAPVLEVFIRVAAAERPDLLAQAVDELIDLASDVGGDALSASALWAQGVRSAAEGRTDTAITMLTRAVELFESARGPYDAARARLDLASVLTAGGRTGAAAEEALAAQGAFERLGATADARRANRLVGLARRTPTGELTSRQIEILRLLAVGLTNREIAERLVLSEHTVKRHVANILTRLDLPSRAAAVAYASRVDLL
ncbi:LuxR C-terminal-related transcriptional regulator [Spirillospora sp. CA-294931]|uniref:LuxR C-terminal-related transcriptional regulator n=1 Tax=Spirillospora sp. CA-294931 TaxID=3240042 RepID=UPI003D91AD7A